MGLRDGSEVLLTLHEGYVAGTIRMGTDLYEVRPTSDGHVIEKIDQASYPACAGSPELELGGIDPAAVEHGDPLARPQGLFAATAPLAAAGPNFIDLMSVYTSQARAAAGGTAQMVAVIQAAVDASNQAFANSGVNAVYRLVRTVETTHPDAGDIGVDLDWLRLDAGVAGLRNQVGADLVSLVVENGGGYCGVGYIMRSPGPGFAGAGFQVTARSCAVGNLTLAHEHGHNLGLEHDAANGPAAGSASYPWSFGYLVNGVFRTVMSYASGCPSGCARIPNFSNPNVSYLGYPTGVANASDNARTANATTPIAAAFRSVPGSTPPVTKPAAPSGLGAAAVSTSQINLTWTDGSTDETGFKVERSTDGVTFTLVTTVGTNVTNYSNTGLAASTLYAFRVRATNSAGDSADSNTASATTQAALTVPAAPSGLSAAAVSGSQINLAWTDASTNETGFKIERSTGSGSFSQIGTVGAGITSYAATGLAGSTTYSFRVRANNPQGDSGFSNTASATTTGSAPSAPGGFRGSPNYVGASLVSVRLYWNSSPRTSSYRLEKCQAASLTAACTFTLYKDVPANSIGLYDTLVASTGRGFYKYRIRADSVSGSSAWVETTVNAQ